MSIDWGPEGYCAPCGRIQPLNELGLIETHSIRSSSRAPEICSGSETIPPAEIPDAIGPEAYSRNLEIRRVKCPACSLTVRLEPGTSLFTVHSSTSNNGTRLCSMSLEHSGEAV